MTRITIDRKDSWGGVEILNRQRPRTIVVVGKQRPVKYVGRPITDDNPFGNPFVVGKDGIRGECCDKHTKWLDTGDNSGNPRATEELRQHVLAKLPELAGHDLECWCYPNQCHAEKLASLANRRK